jgi:putative phosphoesterase
MEIGIISDTHIGPNVDYSGLFGKLEKAFTDVEIILHAGDVTNIKFIQDLEKIGHVEAVVGNLDDPTIHDRYTTFSKIEISGKNIGLIHEMPSFSFIKQEKLDIVVSGHTHIPTIKEYYEINHGFLHLNPGSPLQPRAPPLNARYNIQRKPMPTVMILNIDEELSSAYIITLR